MGRPRGSRNKSTLQKMGLLAPKPLPDVDMRTDDQIVTDLVERFNVYQRLMRAVVEPELVTSVVVSGSAGVGKSYTAEEALTQAKEKKNTQYAIIRGAVSPIGLYLTAYRMREAGRVILMDDADRIFDDDEGLNILKSLLDTTVSRKVSWVTDSHALKQEDVPQEFEFRGSMVFLSNRNFQDYIDAKVGKFWEHMEALMSRSIYLDLRMHTRREVALWVKYLVQKKQILESPRIGLTSFQADDALHWVLSHRDRLRELSLRTPIKVATFMKMEPKQWERMAEVALLRKAD